ncbi:MAG: ATP-binding protein [Flavobacteriaceae bacterium]|jgi:two-component system phosphate regulon sensor histidine kinase PhoR|nr:ATP-binding protein [Flavobacteriaceae bacterium]
MLKRYTAPIQLSLLIVGLFSLIMGGFFFFFTSSFTLLYELIYYAIACQLVLFFVCIYIIQKYIDRFVYDKVEAMYQDLLPTGIPLNQTSVQKDVRSITQSLQQFATDSKLEIQLLKDKENYRKEFIGNLAHELKTPLFMVESYIFTLLEGNIKDKKTRKKYIQKAANGVDRLSFIVKDLDLITQFETGVTTLDLAEFDMVKLIYEMIELLEIKATEKEINLLCSLDPKMPILVKADRERIIQVMSNLIVNSLKYGVENGTTEIEVNDLNTEKVLVRIIDNGKGISEEHLPRLFERFYRVEKTRNRNEGGSGLGLAIVKHIIEAHSEKIYVESSINIGSEFSFTMAKAKA